MKREKIHHFSTHGDAKATVVERFNRTLKSKLYRYFTVVNSIRFVDVLPKLVQQYNHTYHRSIGMACTFQSHSLERARRMASIVRRTLGRREETTSCV